MNKAQPLRQMNIKWFVALRLDLADFTSTQPPAVLRGDESLCAAAHQYGEVGCRGEMPEGERRLRSRKSPLLIPPA